MRDRSGESRCLGLRLMMATRLLACCGKGLGKFGNCGKFVAYLHRGSTSLDTSAKSHVLRACLLSTPTTCGLRVLLVSGAIQKRILLIEGRV